MTEVTGETADLQELGRRVRDQVDGSGRAPAVLREARSRFQLAALQRLSKDARGTFPGFLTPSKTWALAGAFAVALGAAGAWSAGWLPNDDAPLTVAVESANTELVGTWVSADDETKQLSFSDGTALSLHPHTELRVRETTSSGATVELGRGRTLARVEPRERATWRFLAGPFTVRVTGTEFDLAWDPNEQVLELALHQGSVMLSGPSVSGERPVRKGQFVRVTVPRSTATRTSDAESNDGTTRDASAEPADDAPAKSTSKDQAPGAQPDAKSPAAHQGWQESLRAGTPKEAVQAVESAGQGVVLASASTEQLWSLASKARLGGSPALARDALLALRSKHGTRGQTSYLLGKVHADQLGATSQAITWFETYLKEAPGGSLAEQAMGRLAELQAGSRAGKRAAKRYLSNYPQGSYADFCRSQLR